MTEKHFELPLSFRFRPEKWGMWPGAAIRSDYQGNKAERIGNWCHCESEPQSRLAI
ncbi:MAG TPA: hypothetical protein VKJ47_02380 [Candidatus Binatia bacterium]|nr:hypothetical protein [Candidatus Binatia bacterium]